LNEFYSNPVKGNMLIGLFEDRREKNDCNPLNLHTLQKKGSTVETADLNDCLPYENL
jgi:hypothetical protein